MLEVDWQCGWFECRRLHLLVICLEFQDLEVLVVEECSKLSILELYVKGSQADLCILGFSREIVLFLIQPHLNKNMIGTHIIYASKKMQLHD